MEKCNGIESSLITEYSAWDGDQEYIQFYDPVFTEYASSIFGVPAGELMKKYVIVFHSARGKVQVFNEQDIIIADHNIELKVI